MNSHDQEAGLDPVELDDNQILMRLAEDTAHATGEGFFGALVESLKSALGTMGAWIALFDDDRARLRALSMRLRDDKLDGFCYELEGTPCQTAVTERRLVHIPERIIDLYRGDDMLFSYSAVSYMGVPLYGADGSIIGQLAVLHDRPLPEKPRAQAIFKIFAARAAAELRRLQAERSVRETAEQLGQLLDSAMDAVVNLDTEYRVLLMNPAARRAFDCREVPTADLDFRSLLSEASQRRLADYAELVTQPGATQSCIWVAGGLDVVTTAGKRFKAEATLSCYGTNLRRRFTLILRDVNERMLARERIDELTRETQYLKDELRELQPFDNIVGSSKVILHALHEVEQVASTDTTVLLLGETGTGKELFARALHASSKRASKPLVKVNCGAIPANLIESELFGHEKGAFTGATGHRLGRFALADGGTLFLDEIGELPIELQPKLLRVLQDGEFESVGGNRTQKVDVRIVAATHRDLAACVKSGSFREDLFYRLNVFPIRIPALRDRGDDIGDIAQSFATRFARRIGRDLAPLPPGVRRRLGQYSWPGNVRELQNVIERGVILSVDGSFDIDRALPEVSPTGLARQHEGSEPAVRTMSELIDLERDNILRALAASGWKVSGQGGAADLLQINPSTLSSRMRALGIRRPG